MYVGLLFLFTLLRFADASRCSWKVHLNGSIAGAGVELALSFDECKEECEKQVCKSISMRGGKCVLHACSPGEGSECVNWVDGVGAHYTCGAFDECAVYGQQCLPKQKCVDTDLENAGGWECRLRDSPSPPPCTSLTEQQCANASTTCKWSNTTRECLQGDDDDSSMMLTIGACIVGLGVCLFCVGFAVFQYERRQQQLPLTPEEDPLVDTVSEAMQDVNIKPPHANPQKIETLHVDEPTPCGPLFTRGVDQSPAPSQGRKFRRHYFPVEPLRKPAPVPTPDSTFELPV